ncbi:zinc-dependent alcohol dehydrogenase [Ornithinimicrobium cavernae]|uniref:zinc-dependent alcohol dehydrogenase n=1 Tax=Ornithinimicrobium cavernae TaxID=2666047 RepID=UPI000D6A0200|nr:alcohol dehydrogenase catalytic domain-containing protein [Ornithinimicrobium cavernae]
MQAIEFAQDGTASAREVPRPTAGPGEAVVRVTSAGVCGSDISALHGTHPFRKPPLISGHEVGGIVDDIDPESADQLPVGTRVVIDPQWPCQTCGLCTRGDYHLCTRKAMLGVPTWDGGLADFVKVPVFTLVPAPAELDTSLLSFAEPVAVAVHAVRRAGQLTGARTALVLGGGTIGTLITAVLSTQAPQLEITVAEPRDHLHGLLDLAGAHSTVASSEDLPGNAFDLVFLAAGVPSLLETAATSAATGGTVVQVAVFSGSHPVPVGDLQIREITMVGTATYTKDDIASALDVILAKPELVERMVTFTEDWTDAAARITAIAADGPGEVMKLMVRRGAE